MVGLKAKTGGAAKPAAVSGLKSKALDKVRPDLPLHQVSGRAAGAAGNGELEVRVNILVPESMRIEWKLFAAGCKTSVRDLIIQGMQAMMTQKNWPEMKQQMLQGRKK